MTMKNILASGVMGMLLTLSSCSSTKSPDLQKFEARQKALEWNSKKNDLLIELEKKKLDYQKIKDGVSDLNNKANKRTTQFNSSDPTRTAEDAKEVAKLLRDVEKANVKLAKSEREIGAIQRKIVSTQEKVDKLSKQVEFVDKNAPSQRNK